MIAKHTLIAAALMTTLFISAFAHAESKNKCMTLICNADSSVVRTTVSLENLNQNIRAQLQIKAEELANIWGDTILEGDYYADEAVQIDEVEALTRNSILVGYRISYSAQAWDTSTCDFDPEDLESLKDCQSGRISESGFVSADFKFITRDTFAQFIP